MRKLLSKVFLIIAVPFLKLSHNLGGNKKKKNTPQHKRVVAWYKANGDGTLRLNYPLDSNSIVFDVGGFEGNWASDIFCKYGCNVFIFEPVKMYYDQIINRFSLNDKISIHFFGLGGQDSSIKIGIQADASSTFKSNTADVTTVEIQDISGFIIRNDLKSIDLMKINIEGGEYDLMESLIKHGLVSLTNNYQIQFHDFVPDAENRMKRIQESLSRTHELTYQFEFVWENWRRKPI